MKNYFWNLITNIKNGQLAKRNFTFQKKTKLSESILRILWDQGYIIGYKTTQERKEKTLKIFLKYLKNGEPSISNIKFISKPGRRVYYSIKQIWKIDSSKVLIIFSTNKGLKTIIDCKKQKIGGEPLLIIN